MKRLFALAVLMIAAGSVASFAQGPEAAIGTWKLDLAKSSYSPGPAPKSRTITIEAAGQAVSVKVEGVAGDGSTVSYTYTALFDGHDYTISGMGKPGDTVALRHPKMDTVEETFKKMGKVVQTSTIVYAADGKSRTSTQKGKDDQGQAILNVAIYEKQ